MVIDLMMIDSALGVAKGVAVMSGKGSMNVVFLIRTCGMGKSGGNEQAANIVIMKRNTISGKTLLRLVGKFVIFLIEIRLNQSELDLL